VTAIDEIVWTFRGKRIDEMTREEAIEALKWLASEIARLRREFGALRINL
jgi:hypothetical protein